MHLQKYGRGLSHRHGFLREGVPRLRLAYKCFDIIDILRLGGCGLRYRSTRTRRRRFQIFDSIPLDWDLEPGTVVSSTLLVSASLVWNVRRGYEESKTKRRSTYSDFVMYYSVCVSVKICPGRI